MAQDWRKILDNFSGSNTQSSSSSSSSKSSATKSQSDDWRSTLDKFSGSKKTSNYYNNSARKADRATNRARKKKKDEEESSVASRVAARTTYGNKKKDEEERVGSSYLTGGSSTFSAPYAAALQSESEIAPVKSSKKDKEDDSKWYDGYLKKGSEEGVAKSILGSSVDAMEDWLSGFLGSGEKIIDSVASFAPNISRAQYVANGGGMGFTPETDRLFEEQTKAAQKEIDAWVAKDLYDEQAVARKIITTYAGSQSNLAKIQNGGILTEEDLKRQEELTKYAKDYMDNEMESDSYFDEKLDANINSLGNMSAIALGGAIGGAAGIPGSISSDAMMLLTSHGAEYENAIRQGATSEEAMTSALISGGAEVIFEKISGGVKLPGSGKTLDEGLSKMLARKVSNKAVRNLLNAGMDMAGEGFEEYLTGYASAIGQQLTYMSDKELDELYSNEDKLDSFVGGVLLGFLGNAAQGIESKVTGVDTVTGLTQNEQKVVDKLYKDEIAKNDKLTQREKAKIYDRVIEDLEKGYISVDSIVEALGGEKYDQYKQAADWEDSLQTEYDTLSKEYEDLGLKENPNLKDQSRYAELKEMLPGLKQKLDNVKATSTVGQMKAQLTKDAFDMSKSDRLVESFFEDVRSHQKYEADLSKYEGRARDVIKQVMESGLADNSNQSHEFWDMVANMAVDRDTNVSLVDNDQMMELVKKDIEASGKTFDPSKFKGKIVDGIITEDGIAINAKTKRAFNFVVGHEITHSLETAKNYGALQNILFKYAKDEYETRFKERAGQYEDIYSEDEYRAKIDKEVTADLVGANA